ncbi:phospholipase D [Ranunculus cassubicifolius]
MEGMNNKFLHGTLEATIFHATPYVPSFLFNCILVGEKPTYVTIKIDGKKVARTSHSNDRVWNQTLQILCAHPSSSTITITLKRKHSVLGKIRIPAKRIIEEEALIDSFCALETEKGELIPELKLRLILWFKSADNRNRECMGLKGCTYPQRSNCHVTLYQDAHHHSTFKPPGHLHGGVPRKLWEDVYRAIDNAKHLIYIAGWSFNPKLVLVRDPETEISYARGVKIGDLLKKKAEEGVAVRIMLWHDETCLPIIKNKGVMKTDDEDTFGYFKHSKVVCRLCPRLHHKLPTVFAHHQKTISVDIQGRGIMSFIGGLDLCDGRYDTEEHSLFQTLNTESHAQDFYQTSLAGASLHKGGPREPWHDVHACITGEAAWDVLSNFEQRWSKQCDPSLLVHISTMPNLYHSYPRHEDPLSGNWKVQVFRSIDHLSTKSLPDKTSVECSIHEAYVQAIRRAERFIYIENQYFIGGCHLWEKDRTCGCKNLIPVEIALKVANKIKAKERFAVYIVIPMWPEGIPDSDMVQDILHWTRQTMAMMYRLIGEAIQESGQKVHPRDYLNFFCLANREVKTKGELVPPCSPQHATQYWNAQNHRRFMVYVHSKLMIVDDTYLIIGSANVNQRSMDGRRDTEIAIGCYQPKWSGDKSRHSDIHAYRMSLWYEHTGSPEDVLLHPHTVGCVQLIRTIGEEAWTKYSGQEIIDMEGVHLVNYPLSISDDGTVEDLLETGGTFPDSKAPVKGRKSILLPPTFTT